MEKTDTPAISPRISIILPLYRVKDFLPEAVASIKAQTFTDWECLCLDDGSGNGMADFARTLTQDDPRFSVREYPNAGVAATRNRGLDLVRGEFVAFIDQDDAYHPRFLEVLLNAIVSTGVDCAMAHFQSERPVWEPTPGKTLLIRDPCAWLLSQSQLMVSIWTKLWRRSSLGKSRFDPTLFGSDDALFTFSAFAKFRKGVVLLPGTYYFYRRHGGAVSVQAPPRYLFAQLRFLRKLPSVIPARCQHRLRTFLLKAFSDIVKSSGGGRYDAAICRAVARRIAALMRMNRLSYFAWTPKKLLRWRRYLKACGLVCQQRGAMCQKVAQREDASCR